MIATSWKCSRTAPGSSWTRGLILCSCKDCAALNRTSVLLREEVFRSHPDRDHDIVTGLRNTTARIIMNSNTARTESGQTALVTLYGQLAMLGLQIDLDVPDVPLVGPQPPLIGTRLATALLDYSDDLMPRGSSHVTGRPEIVFAFGEADAADATVRISWTTSELLVRPGTHHVPVPAANAPTLVAIAASAAAAAEGIRAAVPVIAQLLDVPTQLAPYWMFPGTRDVHVELDDLIADENRDIGELDAVSGGAITQSALFCLLRVPGVSGRVRVLENDVLDMSNLNRYPLARRSNVGQAKVDVLSAYSTEAFLVSGSRQRLDESTLGTVQPFAPRMIVGVDTIPDRWFAQRAIAGGRLCVACTGLKYAVASEHLPRSACVGCGHAKDEDVPGPTPTIGFLSLWAGIAQAALLLNHGDDRRARAIEMWPLGLDQPHGINTYVPAPNPNCPLECEASRSHRVGTSTNSDLSLPKLGPTGPGIPLK